jgi:hypothetical protein
VIDSVTVPLPGRTQIHQAIEQLAECGVLAPLSASKRNRSWEAVGLLDLLEGLEDAGTHLNLDTDRT